MLKYVSKFALDILPSVVATIIGAYIVNHYIAAKPGTDAPVAAAMSPAGPKKANAKPSEASTDMANIPEAGVRAKGISEKAVFDRSAIEKPAEKSQDKSAEKPQEKSADKPAEATAETRRHQPTPREKTAVRTMPAPVPVVAPVIAAPNTAPAVEAAVVPDEHRDANDLARAAIERLRNTNDGAARATPDASRVVSAPPPVRPLPPPIMVSAPPTETFDAATGSAPIRQPYPAAARADDPHRPTPPADIPVSRPLDLRAEAGEPATREHTSVADDVLSAAKSMFHAVLPK